MSAKARRHQDNGMAYIKLLPRSKRRLRLFFIWPLLFAVRTLAVSRGNPEVLRSAGKITRADLGRIVAVSKLLCRSNGLLAAYYKNLLK